MSAHLSRSAWLVSACLGLALARTAFAEDDTTRRERQLNAEGIALVQSGAHLEAIARFKDAEKLVPRHAHDCNIGQAYLQLKRLAQAWLFFDRCEARMGPTADAWLKELKADLERQLAAGPWSLVTVRVEPTPAEVRLSSLSPDEPWRVDGKKTLWLPAGVTRLEVSAAGVVTETREVPIQGGAPLELAFRLSPPAAAPVTVVAEQRRPLWPIAPMAVGVVGVGVGAWFLLQANDASTRIDALSVGQASAALTLAARGEQQRQLGFILGGAGLAVTAAGVLLYFLLDGVPVTPVALMTPGGAFAGVAGRF